jgi:hypothetical protein
LHQLDFNAIDFLTSPARRDSQFSISNYKLMSSVVFLRAVNVGGANRCRPAELAKQLAKFSVVNIGAVGTFLVRELGGPFCAQQPLSRQRITASARLRALLGLRSIARTPQGALG